eukprot:CAMPEP_0169404868 /NCGR_PEP_ID=MMETSP1017-20121227/56629_1 /TAXON_ID=342587 /ORGANISM="Karlodinium micrum, Strain CCMP2283" /LENGTH=329 /DNA_ID=CAMNT_0009511399 /DNA_START=63 /DNA_END=1049 /DNA_ORIENTATION=-
MERSLEPAKRLKIRVCVLLDLLQTETPPVPLQRFLNRFASANETSIHLPDGYLTEKEHEQLSPDRRGGVITVPGSYEHELLVVGFVILRALLANLLSTWSSSLGGDDSAGSKRAQENLHAIAVLLHVAMQLLYNNVGDITQVHGLAAALGGRSQLTAAGVECGIDPDLTLLVSQRLQTLIRSMLGLEKKSQSDDAEVDFANDSNNVDGESSRGGGLDQPHPLCDTHLAESADAYTEADRPGVYRMLVKAAVTSDVSLDSSKGDVLEAGTRINVIEVRQVVDADRVRGKINTPEGWVSLLRPSDGYRWAEWAEALAHDQDPVDQDAVDQD